MGPATSNRRGGQSLTVLDEAVTVLDDPPVQLRVRGLSVGWGGGRGEHSWIFCSEVSLSDGNEIKKRTKGKRDKDGDKEETISLSLAFNDFTPALYLQSADLWLFNAVLVLLSVQYFTGNANG